VAQEQGIVAGLYDDVLSILPARERTAFVSALAGLVGGRLAAPAHTERPVRRRALRAF